MRFRFRFLLLAPLFAVACTQTPRGPAYSATAFASIEQGVPFTQGKLAAIQAAEKKARDQILIQALQMRFSTGETLETAAILDPFIRAKVYDTIRTARTTDQTVDEENTTVTVTLELDLKPLQRIIERYSPSGG